MTLYMVWKCTNGKCDVLYIKPEEKIAMYLGDQDPCWTNSRYRHGTIEVKRKQDLEDMSRYLYEQGYREESQI